MTGAAPVPVQGRDARGYGMDLMRLWDAPSGTADLSSNDFLVLAAFGEARGQTDTTGGLSRTILGSLGDPMRKATLYGSVNKLARLGLTVQTGTLRGDGRPERVYGLTDAGRLALEVGQGIGESLLAARNAEAAAKPKPQVENPPA